MRIDPNIGKRVSVVLFEDVLDFLHAYAEAAREKNSHWSYGIWARGLGVNDPSSITKILQGQRNPGPDLTEKFVRFFSFSEPEESHFRDLVHLRKLRNEPRLYSLLLKDVKKRAEHNRKALKLTEQ